MKKELKTELPEDNSTIESGDVRLISKDISLESVSAINKKEQTLFKMKFVLPKFKKNSISRIDLEKSLNLAFTSKVFCISAPAGFGKTTLLSQWTSSFKNKDIFFFSVDSNDNNIKNFFFYLLNTFAPIINTKYFDFTDEYNTKYFFNLLFNKIAEYGKNIMLIIDDYQNISDEQIHKLFYFFIEKSPDNLHFVISSRSELPPCFSKLRTSFSFLEMGMTDLSFKKNEIKEIFDINNIQITEDDLDTIHKKTEGWILSIDLTILSLKNNLIDNFLNKTNHISNRYLMDFLLDQILNSLDKDIYDFVVKTSILEHFDSYLCNKLLNIDNAQKILEKLEKQNVFLINIDNNRKYFRYHNLFSDVLREKLKLENNELFKNLAKKASNIFKDMCFYEDAIKYAFLSEDKIFVADIVESLGHVFFKNKDTSKLFNIIEKLDSDIIFSKPKLAIYYAITLGYNYNTIKAESILSKLENEYKNDKKIDNEKEALFYFAYVSIYLRTISNRSKIVKYVKLLENKILYLNHLLLNIAYLELSRAFFVIYDLEKSLLLIGRLINLIEKEKDPLNNILIRKHQANILYVQGDLIESEEIIKEIVVDLEKYNLLDHKISILIFKDLARIYYQWNNIELFDLYISKATLIAEKDEDYIYKIDLYNLLVFFNLKLKRKKEFNFFFNKLQDLLITRNINFPPTIIIETIKIIYLMSFESIDSNFFAEWEKKAKKYLNSEVSKSSNTINSVEIINTLAITIIRFYILKNNLREADRVLELLDNVIKNSPLKLILTQSYILKAIILKKQGKTAQAISLLRKVLINSKKSNYIRIFVEYNDDIKDLLIEICESLEKNKVKIKTTFEYKILQAFSEPIIKNLKNASIKKLVNPLSKKEMEIFNFVYKGMPNKDISDKLDISLNTLKTHLKHIYKKLDAKNRKEAVVKAREMGFVL